jgi:hypothetical protein
VLIVVLSVTPVLHLRAQAPRVTAADIDFLIASIRSIHPNPYRRFAPSALDSAAAALRERLPSLTPQRAIVETQRILAMVGDGHTEWAVLPALLRGRWLPLIFRRFKEGWFVTTGDPTYSRLFGKPITGFAGMPMDHVVQRVIPYVSGDNDLDKLDDVGDFLRNVFVLEALGIRVGVPDRVAVTVLESDGSHTTLPVEATGDSWVTARWRDADKLLNPGVPEALYRRLDGNYACAWLPDDRVLYVLFSEVRDDGDMSIAAFFDRVSDFARRVVPEKFVLDIRDNSGGNLELNGPVLRSLMANPRLDHPGRVFVIIGPDTYSAAMNLAVLLERYTHALFVGAPTGASPNHFGDTRVVELPDSRIRVEISELYWQNSDPRDARPWITPDLVADPSASALIAGRDPVLDAILQFESSDSLVAGFGATTRRWRRPGQLQAAAWPTLLTPAARPLDWSRAASEPRSEACTFR